MTPERLEKLRRTALRRQTSWTVVLENVHDPHNIAAVLRTCESAGIPNVYVVYNDPRLNEEHLKLGQRASASARKWVDVHFFNDLQFALKHLRHNYTRLLGAYMDDTAQSVYELDMSEPCALVFGNEREGISKEFKSELDGLFFIPQHGLVQSLNISVACAVSIYEGVRQRMLKGLYDLKDTSSGIQLWEEYQKRHNEKHDGGELIFHSPK